MIAGGVIALLLLVRSNIRFRRKRSEVKDDTLFQTILNTENRDDVWPLLRVYINEKQKMFLDFAAVTFGEVTSGFVRENGKTLSRAERALAKEKEVLKSQRRKLTLCLRLADPEIAMEKNAWFHLSNNMAMSMSYNLRRINEVCKEHVDNTFRPLPQPFRESFVAVCDKIAELLRDSAGAIEESVPETIDMLRRRCDTLKSRLTDSTRKAYEYLQNGDRQDLTVVYVYLNALQESQEFVTSLRKMLRASGKLNLAPTLYRSFSESNRAG